MTADVKNKRSGDKKSGKKITGMQFLGADNTKLLITSNDSRIRLYDGESPDPLCIYTVYKVMTHSGGMMLTQKHMCKHKRYSSFVCG